MEKRFSYVAPKLFFHHAGFIFKWKGQKQMNLTKAQRLLFSSSLSVFLAGCGSPNYSQSEMHMTIEEAESAQRIEPEKIPALVRTSPTVPALAENNDSATFDVVVTSVPVRDLLFALARDAGVNMDIDDKVGGYVSISALDQTLNAILARISEQVAIRIDRVGDAIVIKPDEPYVKYYHIDFINVARTYSSSATAGGVGDTGSSSVSNSGSFDFWSSFAASLEIILETSSYSEGEENPVTVERTARGEEGAEETQTAEGQILSGGNAYDLNPDTGLLVVYAPGVVHKEVQELLDRNLTIAKRQVLLEATVVEVVLNNQYAQGIDWSLFNSLATDGLALYQGGTVGGAASALEYLTSVFEYTLTNQEFRGEDFYNLTKAEVVAFYGADAVIGLDRLGDGDRLGAVEADFVARNLALAAVNEAREAAYDNPLNRVTEFDTTIDTESEEVTVTNQDGEDTTLTFNTYEVSGSYSREEINETSTALSSGGLVPNNPQADSFFTAAYRQGDISAAVQLLDTFGDAKVLSSPRISVLNHQPALLRVVDQEVYFNFTVEETVSEETGLATSREFVAEENTVDVGFSMNVFPQISAEGEVLLNLKPSVTRVLDYRQAPILESFGSAAGGTQNFVPITRVRELESVLSLRDGEIAVMGGLLEDRTGDNSSSVPGLSRLPGVGALFEKKNESTYKTEFVVFIRAKIIKDPSVNGDYSGYRHLLPNTDFIIRDTEDTLVPPAQLKTR